MGDTNASELNTFFSPNGELAPEVQAELQSILRLYGIDPQELFYKWESYSIKMGVDTLNLKIVREFKKDIQDALERESRSKAHQMRGAPSEKRAAGTTSRGSGGGVGGGSGAGGDIFGMLDSLIPNTPKPGLSNGFNSAAKRKSKFETPVNKNSRVSGGASLGDRKYSVENDHDTPTFANRSNAGETTETLNNHITLPTETPEEPFPEPRVRVKLNTEVTKFAYKTMAMKLSEASEVLDDRIDEFAALVQTHYELEDSAFGNPTCQSTNEIIAIGRIASDTNEGKPNAASLLLETSRRTGSGMRVPLRVDGLGGFDFFQGMIVALKGTNASGEFFSVSEVIKMPLLPLPASTVPELRDHRRRINPEIDSDANEMGTDIPSSRPLTILIGSGPYTPEANLSFEPFHALLSKATETFADALFLTGPFLDIEHPLVASGKFPLSSPPFSTANVDPDTADMNIIFRILIAQPLHRLTQKLPHITIFIIPSTRDAAAQHVSWPQRKLARNVLGLPKQCIMLTNPVMLSVNEMVIGVTGADVLEELRRSECFSGSGAATRQKNDMLARLSGLVIQQRHFFPVYPAQDRVLLQSSGNDGKAAGSGASSAVARTTASKGSEVKQDPDTVMTNGGTDHDDGNRSTERHSMGAMLDLSYLKLGDWSNVRPDMLILPSALTPFAKVVESVLTINPGTVSKKRGPGSYARLTVLPPAMSDEDAESTSTGMIGHRLYERARVDINRI